MNFSSAPALDKKIYDLTAENVRTLSKRSASTGIDCELETNGVLQVAGKPGTTPFFSTNAFIKTSF